MNCHTVLLGLGRRYLSERDFDFKDLKRRTSKNLVGRLLSLTAQTQKYYTVERLTFARFFRAM